MNHIIKKQTLAINIPADHDAWDVQNSIKELFYQDVLPRLERVCDELELDPRASLRLNTLTVNTGSIKPGELFRTWAEEVENAFREELLRIKKEKLPSKDEEKLSASEQSELTAFLHFLENGIMPWWISDEFNVTPEELLDRLLAEQPAQLVCEMLLLKNKGRVSKRLLCQFEPKKLKKLLKHFEQSESASTLQKFREIIESDVKPVNKDLARAFLATEIITNLTPDTSGNKVEKLFTTLFTQINEHDLSVNHGKLKSIHNHLTDKQKELKISQSVEAKKLVSTALAVLNKLSLSLSESRTQQSDLGTNPHIEKSEHTSPFKADKHSTNSGTSETRDQIENDLNPNFSSGSGSDQNETKASPETGNKDGKKLHAAEGTEMSDAATNEQKASFTPQHKSPHDEASPPGDHLSTLDKRAWEHIERIKKLQLAEITSAEEKSPPGAKDERLKEGKESSNSTDPSLLKPGKESGASSVLHSESTSEMKNHIDQPTDQNPERETSQRKNLPSDERNTQNRKRQDMADAPASSNKYGESPLESVARNIDAQTSSEVDQTGPNPQKQQDQPAHPAQIQSDITTPLPDSEFPEDSPTETFEQESLTGPNESTRAINPKSDKNTLEYWQEELETIEECYIQNAGLILFWPYLGHFFKDLGLNIDGKFKSRHDQQRAVLILQHLLDESPDFQEYKLPLNKLLCGLKISQPVEKSIELLSEDLDKCNKLLEATIENWSALRGTSVAGFQNSFVKRPGLLKRHDKYWQLQVEKKPFDMLMEQLPWPIGIVRLSWMKKPIYVEW